LYAGAKLSLYANDTSWAMIFEYLMYNGGEKEYEIFLDYFGNCLKGMDTFFENGRKLNSNSKRITLINEKDFGKIITTNGFFIKKNADSIKLGSNIFKIEHNVNKYLEKGIEPYRMEGVNQSIDCISLLRYLYLTFPDKLFAPELAKKRFLSVDLPKLMELNDWYHQEYFNNYGEDYIGVPPSTYETFQMLAEVLVTKDTTKYKPTLKPNTHWSNWTND